MRRRWNPILPRGRIPRDAIAVVLPEALVSVAVAVLIDPVASLFGARVARQVAIVTIGTAGATFTVAVAVSIDARGRGIGSAYLRRVVRCVGLARVGCGSLERGGINDRVEHRDVGARVGSNANTRTVNTRGAALLRTDAAADTCT